MSDPVYSVGDWVTITGRIVEFHPNTIDLGVEVFSKTDQYIAFVRRDLCAPTKKPLPSEPGDGSVALLNGSAYQRLAGGMWYAAGSVATSADGFATLGRSWAELNVMGDVEVIHHA